MWVNHLAALVACQRDVGAFGRRGSPLQMTTAIQETPARAPTALRHRHKFDTTAASLVICLDREQLFVLMSFFAGLQIICRGSR